MMTNLSYWIGSLVGAKLSVTIYAMIAACLLPYVWTSLGKISGGFRMSDNKNPRDFFAKSTGLSARMNAAQMNSFESLPMFLAAVLMAIYCLVPQQVINGIAWLYVGLRVAYGIAYMVNASALRSVLWFLSIVCIVMLFTLSLRVMS